MSILVAMLIIVFLVVNRGKFVPLLRVLGSVFANNRVCSSHFRRRKGRREERGVERKRRRKAREKRKKKKRKEERRKRKKGWREE